VLHKKYSVIVPSLHDAKDMLAFKYRIELYAIWFYRGRDHGPYKNLIRQVTMHRNVSANLTVNPNLPQYFFARIPIFARNISQLPYDTKF